jgi:hypothetical protein
MANTYIDVNGVEVAFTQTGPGTQGQGVGLNSAGVVDGSLMPAGYGPTKITVTTSAVLVAGALVNLWNNSGTINARNANATDNTKPYHGFVLSGYGSSVSATVYLPGAIISGLSGLTIAKDYYLNTTDGTMVQDISSFTGGNIIQYVGYSISTTQIITGIQAGVTNIRTTL